VNKTQSEYVIFIVFVLQQRLHERASLLRYMYIACIVRCVIYLVILMEDQNASCEKTKDRGKKTAALDVGKLGPTG